MEKLIKLLEANRRSYKQAKSTNSNIETESIYKGLVYMYSVAKIYCATYILYSPLNNT